ncbi:MAG: hypothetical protein LUI60_06540 [Clostridia bacterium]|nr:hypothetical protein [Clostridia bacterium]
MEVKKIAEMTGTPESDEQIIQTDIMRYKRNSRAANFALLSLVFECFYFMVFYSFNNADFNTLTIGFSVVVNLCILLITMLAEEGIKNYNYNYSITLLVLAAVQIIRIFYYPLKIFKDSAYTTYFFFCGLSNVAFGIILIIFLVLGAACLVASAIFGYIQAKKLENFNKAIENGTISVDDALKRADAEEAQEVTNA